MSIKIVYKGALQYKRMLPFIISLLFAMSAAEDFKLVAAARTSLLGNSDEAACIKTAGDIEYWVNMATQAQQATKIVASGGLQMNSLEVQGTFKLGDSNKNDNTIKGDTTFKQNVYIDGELALFLYNRNNGVQTSKVQQSLASKIDALEQKIDKLCQASQDGGANVCEL